LVVPNNDLVEGIILRAGTIFREKPKIFDRAMTELMHYSLLEGVAFGEPGVPVLSWWWMYCCC
jgi:hypothetical protein